MSETTDEPSKKDNNLEQDHQVQEGDRMNIIPSNDQAIIRLTQAMVNQENAKRLIEPMEHKLGFWFGGGNVIEEEERTGELWLCGRYRNEGDSRTGPKTGDFGVACAIFRCSPSASSFDLVHYWTKKDLTNALQTAFPQNGEVISIEGTCLHWNETKQLYEFYISSEKLIPYPMMIEKFQKEGTGVWSVDRIRARRLEDLELSCIETVLASNHPSYLHIKDPVVYSFVHTDGTLMNGMLFSNAPYSWTSCNTGLAVENQTQNGFHLITPTFVPRGSCWDVSATRITCRFLLPSFPVPGAKSQREAQSFLYFYDGAECMREHDESSHGFHRPRGWSCEELGGLFIQELSSSAPNGLRRVSEYFPFFVSPWGTGCCRFVDACWTSLGLFTSWQQSQPGGSQPLVYTLLSIADVKKILLES